MFIPLHDRNRLEHIDLQYVTLGLIALNVLIWLATSMSGQSGDFTTAAVLGFGYIPAVANGVAQLPAGLDLVPAEATYLTYAFLHGDIWHLGMNMLFLWVFGDNIEDALGHAKFLIFYLACAAAGAFAHGLLDPQSQVPLIGASGAVAGVVAAYLILHPRVRIWVLVMAKIPLPLPAFVPLLFWVGYQVVMLVTDRDGSVSWAAHAGGIVAGALLVIPLKRRAVPLFDRELVLPRAVVRTGDKPKPPGRAWGRRGGGR